MAKTLGAEVVPQAASSTWDQQIILTAQQASVRFGKHALWQDASFSIVSGEFITILGPNGAGKTTLLRLLLGLLPVSQGSIELFGEPPRRGNPLIGYVPQRRTLEPHLRVRARDFVGLGLDGHKWGIPLLSLWARRQQNRRIEHALAAVGAQTYADRSIGQLSGGEQQRLLLAFALLTQPRLLLLDEPLASLDMQSQQRIAQLVAQVAREHNITVLLVTHDLNPLLPYTDRVLYIAQGGMTAGTPDEVITTEQLSRLYQAPIEVMRDRHGRLLIFGLEQATSVGNG